MPDGSQHASTMLVSIFGRDQPDITSSLFRQLAVFDATILDVEKVRTQTHITLCVRIHAPRHGGCAVGELRTALRDWASARELHSELTPIGTVNEKTQPGGHRSHVTLVGPTLSARTTAAVSTEISALGGRIDRITPLARRPVTAIEFLVSGPDVKQLRAGLYGVARSAPADLAISEAGLSRRARRLVVMDVDSTLIQDEVIDLFGEYAGCGTQISAITEAAMRGEIDFEESLRARVALLAGLDASVVDAVSTRVRLTPGALSLVRTLRRLGYRIGAVSGGFTQVTEYLAWHLGLDFSAANTLEIADGKLTGRLIGDIVDRAAKARLLMQYANEAGIPMAQTVAIGDGANDLDMLNAAGLGVAFNAKPLVRKAAPTTLNSPSLDSLLYLLGIPHDEMEVVTEHRVLQVA
ncbi:phosphoserine phosphatase SerB [Streptomyces sp. NPDC050485]|uniref:phosphoserine phosphatase SerB n=1 Tax=Streptomyces sp. NPDC050485 TaxID=3365617 RepID=UPI0037A3045B